MSGSRFGNRRLSPILTKEGGIAIPFINKTGANSIKGTLVNTESSIDMGVRVVQSTLDEPDIIGVIYEDGIPDGEEVLVIISGIAEVLIHDGESATRGYWCRTSELTDGRADITNAAPPGGTINAIEGHFREIGHCLETKSSGTDVLVKIVLHFN